MPLQLVVHCGVCGVAQCQCTEPGLVLGACYKLLLRGEITSWGGFQMSEICSNWCNIGGDFTEMSLRFH